MKIFLASALLTCAMFTAQAPAMAEEYSATIATGHPSIFRWVKMIDEAFIPSVADALKGTEHTLNFTKQYAGAIAGVGEELEAVEAGLAELGTCQSLFDPAKLGVQNVTYYTPFITENVRILGDLMHQLYLSNDRMKQAYADNGVTYVGAPMIIDDYLLMTNFPVNSLADLEGKKIGAPGPAINWLSGTGAVGVSGNLTTYYNELKAGVFDGVIVFASAALPGKLYEVAPYITKAGLGAQSAGSICANIDWWDGLPDVVQQSMLDAGAKTSEWYLSNLEMAVVNSFKIMEENGAIITNASDEFRMNWASGMNNSAKVWAESLEASEFLSSYLDELRVLGTVPLRDWDKE